MRQKEIMQINDEIKFNKEQNPKSIFARKLFLPILYDSFLFPDDKRLPILWKLSYEMKTNYCQLSKMLCSVSKTQIETFFKRGIRKFSLMLFMYVSFLSIILQCMITSFYTWFFLICFSFAQLRQMWLKETDTYSIIVVVSFALLITAVDVSATDERLKGCSFLSRKPKDFFMYLDKNFRSLY